MSSPAIAVPFCSRDEDLVDVAGHCRHLPPAERATMRELITHARTSGIKTAGELIDRLAGMTPAERRGVLDRARVACGRPTVSEERIRTGEALLKLAPNTRPMHLEARGAALVEVWEDEELGLQSERQRLAAIRQTREAETRRELAELDAHERAHREQLDRELPEHLRGHR
jgi:hypothetical protein